MTIKFFYKVLAVAGLLVPATAQVTATSKATGPWKPSLTPDGQPSIEGIYARAGIYGLAAQLREANGPTGAENPLDDSAYSYAPDGSKRVRNAPVWDQVQGEGARNVPLAGPSPTPPRTLGIVDPANKILPWIPEEDKKRREFLLKTNPAQGLRYIEFDARCALPGLFLNGGPFQFIQPEQQVVILSEYQHYTRTIYLDGRPHVAKGLRFFMGDSIGHWEGNTLVVDTTNFNEFTSMTREIPYFSDALHTIERFTIADENNLDYEATIDDPKLFTKPWKVAALYRKSKPGYQLMEFGCAEGSHTLENIFGTPPALKGQSLEK